MEEQQARSTRYFLVSYHFGGSGGVSGFGETQVLSDSFPNRALINSQIILSDPKLFLATVVIVGIHEFESKDDFLSYNSDPDYESLQAHLLAERLSVNPPEIPTLLGSKK